MAKNKFTTSYNPVTGKAIGKTPENTANELERAVALAKIAQSEWAKLTFHERAQYLFRIRDYIVSNVDHIVESISKNCGKTRVDALSMEVFSITMAISYYANHAHKILKRKRLSGGNILIANKRAYVDRVPVGVVGIISPWNYPFAIPFHEISMALIAGNAVILKVATQSLEVGKLIKECIQAANLPENIFHIVNIPGRVAGEAFFNAGINKLFFTGSVPVGKLLMEQASKHLIPVSLELGGNDAMIVCADANLYRAVGGALWAGIVNTGQSCGGVERIYIEAEVYDEFLSILKQKMSELRMGVDEDSNVDVGSMTTKEQWKKVKLCYTDALKKGGKVFPEKNIISKNLKGLFFPPVIIENLRDDMMVVNEEIFGPILTVQKVVNVEEAIARANASKLGLTASVWTKNRKKGHAIAARLEVGSVMINDHLMSHGMAETPWGGWKESGIGRTHGYIGLEEMTQPRCVIDDILPSVQKNMWWYPHSKKIYVGLKGAIELLYSKNLWKKLTGSIRLVGVFIRTFQK
jgi:succinate-semialdehyde dehydrogenase/glutarate-semialdehyde dehydrogenase